MIELSSKEVVQINKSVIKVTRSFDSESKENHHLRDAGGLESCLGSIFYRDSSGSYLNNPLAKMAGLILYRLAETQLFENGNKRTALYSTNLFLKKNGYNMSYSKKEISDLMWGFAKPKNGKPAKYCEHDSIEFILQSIYILQD